MNLDLLTNARVVDDAIRFVSDNQNRAALSSYASIIFQKY
jgi:hypothetical protein